MKKLLVLAAVAATLTTTVGATGAYAFGKQDFRIVNKTGYDINEVYVSPSRANRWGHDVMGDGTLGADRFRNIRFSPDSRACHYDLKVVYADKDTAEWSNIDLCTVQKITLHWNRKTHTSTMESE
jgi:hypothetical protein